MFTFYWLMTYWDIYNQNPHIHENARLFIDGNLQTSQLIHNINTANGMGLISHPNGMGLGPIVKCKWDGNGMGVNLKNANGMGMGWAWIWKMQMGWAWDGRDLKWDGKGWAYFLVPSQGSDASTAFFL